MAPQGDELATCCAVYLENPDGAPMAHGWPMAHGSKSWCHGWWQSRKMGGFHSHGKMINDGLMVINDD